MYEEKPKRRPRRDFEQAQEPCPICGGTAYEWGRLQRAYYQPGGNFFRLSGNKIIGLRRCLRCDNLQQFVDERLTERNNTIAWLMLAILLAIFLLTIFLPFLVR